MDPRHYRKIEYTEATALGTIVMYDDQKVERIRQDIQFRHHTISPDADINPERNVNGVTDETVLELLAVRLRILNQKFPCRGNSIAITKIEEARLWLQDRAALRVDQGVEGKHANHVTKDEQAASNA